MVTKSHLACSQEQHALLTSPDKMQRATCKVCDWSCYLKLWQHLLLTEEYLWSLAHWISSRYSSSRNRFAFIKVAGTVWCSLLAMDFPDFVISLNMAVHFESCKHGHLFRWSTPTVQGKLHWNTLLARNIGSGFEKVNLILIWVNNIFVITRSDVNLNLLVRSLHKLDCFRCQTLPASPRSKFCGF